MPHIDIVREARERLEAAWLQDRENREDAFTDLKFLAGDQWPAAVRQQREAQSRPCLTINRLPQFVHQVANSVRMNPPQIKAIPAGGAATDALAEIYSGLFRHIQYRSNATHVFAHAVYYAVACGIGHFRLATDYVDDNAFEQEILIKRIPHPLSVFWDPAAIEPSRADADYCLVSEMIGRKEFEARFSHAAPVDFDTPADGSAESGLFWASRDAVRVCEYWVKRPVERAIARLARGETVDITEVDPAELPRLGIVATRKVRSHKVERWLLSGSEVLEGPNAWAGRTIPIFPVIGAETALETKTVRSGLIRAARDPQQLYNFWRSAAAEAIALAPRSPFLATPAMIAKFKGQWDTQNSVARPYLLYEPDPDAPGSRPMREPPPDVPTALTQESAIAADEMKATTGIYDAALGARSNEISGVAIRARENQGGNAALHYQDNLMATLHHLGKALIDLVPKIYDSERTLRIMREDDSQEPVRINAAVMGVDGKPMLLNDLSQGVYDVRVKIGPAYATRRSEAADAMLQFIRAVPQAAGIAGDLVAKTMDWPGADEIAARLKRTLPPQVTGEAASPEVRAAQARQQALAEAELARAQSLAAKSGADAAKAEAVAQQAALDAAKAEAELKASGMAPAGPAAH
ncbi:portal protein [Rhodomicrobium lacus]|uniref:portal protein n=1 Tax=Rhodomicrobium lacus TaxID=2498452 RepID=UPI0026E17987|nr:portal protein [Rhodomicrobium lacus]WKW49501.1 portal protein [Rhodomicrobium lacus]